MKIILIGEPQTIMSNPECHHSYFGWPTVARLQNGKLAVVASGFRLFHVCPFGKAVISYSEDEGQTYTPPAPVIDTVLDDRDSGILPFGKSSVIVTSFNNSVEFQRGRTDTKPYTSYIHTYLDTITNEEERQALGATFRISHDCGVTFGPIYKSPVTSPHGPVELADGTLLWLGRTFAPHNEFRPGVDCIQAHRICADGTTAYVGTIETIQINGVTPKPCEPHAIVLDDGTILVHIRVSDFSNGIFTILQSESKDNGKTWTSPRQILPLSGGAPPHLFRHSSGLLMCTYGHRGTPFGNKPYGIKVMFSQDNGKTWDADYSIYTTDSSLDLGYPSSVELSDGSMLTVFYGRPSANSPAVIMQQRWRFA